MKPIFLSALKSSSLYNKFLLTAEVFELDLQLLAKYIWYWVIPTVPIIF